MEIWRATPGSESRVKAAEHLFDHSVDLEATQRFLADGANVLLIAYDEDEPAGAQVMYEWEARSEGDRA